MFPLDFILWSKFAQDAIYEPQNTWAPTVKKISFRPAYPIPGKDSNAFWLDLFRRRWRPSETGEWLLLTSTRKTQCTSRPAVLPQQHKQSDSKKKKTVNKRAKTEPRSSNMTFPPYTQTNAFLRGEYRLWKCLGSTPPVGRQCWKGVAMAQCFELTWFSVRLMPTRNTNCANVNAMHRWLWIRNIIVDSTLEKTGRNHYN